MLITGETVLERSERLLTTETILLEGLGRLLAIRRNSAGGARETVDNRSNVQHWRGQKTVNNMSNSISGAIKAVNNRSNRAGAETLLTTGATVFQVPLRLLTTGATGRGQRDC